MQTSRLSSPEHSTQADHLAVHRSAVVVEVVAWTMGAIDQTHLRRILTPDSYPHLLPACHPCLQAGFPPFLAQGISPEDHLHRLAEGPILTTRPTAVDLLQATHLRGTGGTTTMVDLLLQASTDITMINPTMEDSPVTAVVTTGEVGVTEEGDIVAAVRLVDGTTTLPEVPVVDMAATKHLLVFFFFLPQLFSCFIYDAFHKNRDEIGCLMDERTGVEWFVY